MTSVLFVCIENSCRSQMAEAIARHMCPDKAEFFSAGSVPSGKINPGTVYVLKEIGIELNDQYSKGFNALPLKEFDRVITMGCRDSCPSIKAAHKEDWAIEGPRNGDLGSFREARDKIKAKLEKLFKDDLKGGE